MKANKRLNKAILEVVENQLRDLDPPETKETFDRLIEQGYSKKQARTLIGFVVASEIFDILKYMKPYNHERYVDALRRLPELPVDEEE
ncbi:MAG: hypothetical protein DMF60_08835 [Acidobacteria bacterium]|nr:MAG: hypothetical protein DMF60_08835 [Acidobacteriota bacterium]